MNVHHHGSKGHTCVCECDRSNMNLQHHEHEGFFWYSSGVRAGGGDAAFADGSGRGSAMQRLFFLPSFVKVCEDLQKYASKEGR